MKHLYLAHETMQKLMQGFAKNGLIKERLINALLESSFVRIKDVDLYDIDAGGMTKPYEQLKAIHAKLSTVPAKGAEATFVASIEAMTDEEAEAVASMLVVLASGCAQGVGAAKAK